VIEDDRPYVRTALNNVIAGRGDYDVEYRIIVNGEIRWMWSKGEAQHNEEGKPVRVSGVIGDITEQKMLRSYTDLLLKLLITIDSDDTLSVVFNKILEMICVHNRWDYGEVWVFNDINTDLSRISSWFNREDEKFATFDKISEKFNFKEGIGIPGLTASEKKILWISDLHSEKNYLRSSEVKKAGLRSLISVPVLHEDNVLAVFMFYSGFEIRENEQIEKFMFAIQNDLALKLHSKQVEENLKREQELMKLMFQNIPVMITVYNPQLSEFSINEEFKKVTGYTDEDVITGDFIERVYPDEKLRKQALEFMKKPDGSWMDMEMRSRSGGIILSTWTNVRLSDDTQIGIGLDITDRKINELELLEKEYLLAEAQKVANLGAFRLDLKTGVAGNSPTLNRIFGFDEDELLTIEKWESCIHPDFIEDVVMYMEQCILLKKKFDREYKIIRKSDGAERWVYGLGILQLDEEGNPDSMICTIQDITIRKEQENAIREQRDKLIEAEKMGQIGHWEMIFNSDELLSEENKVNLSEMLQSMMGFTEGSFDGTPNMFLNSVVEDDRERLVSTMISQISEGEIDVSYRITGEDQNYRYLHSVGKVSYKDDGSPYMITGLTQDITERKNYEIQIQKNLDELQEIYDYMPVMINIHDESSGIAAVNRYFEEHVGYSTEDANKLDLLRELVPDEEEYQKVKMHIEKLNGEWQDFELRTKDGIFLKTTWSNIQLADGKSLGIGIDITEREKLQQEVRDKEERLTLATTNAEIGLWEWHPQTGVVIINKVWANLVGYSIEELEPVSIETWNKLVHPDDLKHFEVVVNDYFEGKAPYYEAEIRMKHKEGHWVWILDKGRTVEWDDEGKPIRMLGTHIDITEEKKTRDELRQSEERLQLATDNTRIALYDWNVQTGELIINENWASIIGYTKDELEPISIEIWEQVAHPEDFKISSKELERHFKGETEVYDVQVRMKHKAGHWVWVLGRGKVVEWDDDDGKPIRMIGTHIDITDRVESESMLRYNSFVLQNVTEAVITLDKEYKVQSWNESAEQLYGYTADEMIGNEFDKMIDTIYLDFDAERIREEFEKTGQWQGEAKQSTKDGIYKTVLSSVNMLKDDDGTMVGVVALNRDITDLKNQQEELIRSRDQLLQAQQVAGLGHWEMNLQTGVLTWSDSIYEMFGLQKDYFDINIESFLDVVHPDDREKLKYEQEQFQSDGFIDSVYRVMKPDGSVGIFQEKGKLIKDEEGNNLLLTGTVLDITELKETERELQLLADVFRLTNSGISIGSYEQKEFIRVNDANAALYGYTAKEMAGMPIENVYAEDYRHLVPENIAIAEERGYHVFESVHMRKDGSRFPVLINLTAVKNEAGEILYRIATTQDITAMKKAQAELEKERIRFELIAKSTNDVIYHWEVKTDYHWWNEGIYSKFGYDAVAVENTIEWWESKIHPDEKAEITASMWSAINNAESEWKNRYRFEKSDGSYALVYDRCFLLADDDGVVTGMIGAITDITAENEAKVQLERSEEQYRLLFERNPIPMFIYDPETFKFIEVNDAAVKNYGYEKKEFLQLSILDIRPESDKEKVMINVKEKIGDEVRFEEWVHFKKNGEQITVEISASDINYAGETYRLVIANDISEQKQIEKQVINSLIEGEERERRRVAMELHDGLGQYLSAANMTFDAILEYTKAMPEEQHEQYKHGLGLLKHAIKESRSVAQNLLPKAIEDFGLALAVEALVDDYRKNTDIQFYYYQNVEDHKIAQTIEINLFRMIQEALNNAIKHANCSKIDVQIVKDDNDIVCTIDDNGIGFDYDGRMIKSGLGMQSLQTRSRALNGDLDIITAPGKGTLISIIIPLNSSMK
jgi:PAS domain S-box-containing protein